MLLGGIKMIDPKKRLVFKNTYFVQLVPPWFWPPRFLQSEVSELLLEMDSGSSIGSSRSGSHTTRYLAAASLAVLHLAGSSLFCSAHDMFCILAGADSRLQHCSLQTYFFGADFHRSLRLRLVGWMSPEYAEKFGAFALRDYLSASPLSAAVVVQSSWSVLLGPCNNLFCPDGESFLELPVSSTNCRLLEAPWSSNKWSAWFPWLSFVSSWNIDVVLWSLKVGPCTDQATKMGSSLASLWVDVAAGILPGSLFAPDACHVVQVLHRHHASHQYLGVSVSMLWPSLHVTTIEMTF